MDDIHAGVMLERASAVLLLLLAITMLLVQERCLEQSLRHTTERVLQEPVLVIAEGG